MRGPTEKIPLAAGSGRRHCSYLPAAHLGRLDYDIVVIVVVVHHEHQDPRIKVALLGVSGSLFRYFGVSVQC